MRRESHARFCERLEVKFLRPTHHRVHYILDVSMHEDASRVRKSPTILSILRSFALNILRFNKVNNVADALWRNAMNLNRVLAYSGI